MKKKLALLLVASNLFVMSFPIMAETYYGVTEEATTAVVTVDESATVAEPAATVESTQGADDVKQFSTEEVSGMLGFDNIVVDTQAASDSAISRKVSGFVTSLVNVMAAIYPALVIAQFFIDLFYIPFPAIQHVVLTYVPIPINSQEAYKVTGTQFTRANSNNGNGGGQFGGGGGMGGNNMSTVSGNQGEQASQNGQPKNIMTMFIGMRVKTVFISTLFLLAIRVGLFDKITVFVFTKVANPIMNIIG